MARRILNSRQHCTAVFQVGRGSKSAGLSWNAGTHRRWCLQGPRLRIQMRSLASRPKNVEGLIIDPLRVEDLPPDVYPFIISPAWWRLQYEFLREGWKSGVSIGFIMKHCPGFKVQDFNQKAKTLFEDFFRAFRNGDDNAMRTVTTPFLYKQMRERMKPSKAGRRVSMELLDIKGPLLVVRVRHVYTRPMIAGIGQVALKVSSRRRIVPVGKDGRELSKDDDPSVPETEELDAPCVLVCEVNFEDPSKAWRIAGLLEAEASQSGQSLKA